jgi:hypothetical protein
MPKGTIVLIDSINNITSNTKNANMLYFKSSEAYSS